MTAAMHPGINSKLCHKETTSHLHVSVQDGCLKGEIFINMTKQGKERRGGGGETQKKNK